MPKITAENARIFAAKAHESRRKNQIEEQQQRERATLTDSQQTQDGYKTERVCRVREQLDRIDERILEQSDKGVVDGQTLNWLCSAQEKLSEQLRKLLGVPLPGSMRPSPAPTRRQSQAYAAPMIEDDVAPQPAPEAQAPAKPQTYTGPETG